MLTLRKTLTLTVAAALLLLVGFAQTASAAELSESQVASIGSKIVLGAHYSGENVRLADYSYRGQSLYITMDWNGGILGTPYTSTIRLDFSGSRVKTYSYKDNAFVAFSARGVEDALYEFNRSR